ncbi:MAG TPA: hypothetical protein VHD37_02305 [Candidatus Paceibacterota bacterium]|nr:hypothetical protein [Candidatus Paceibacterota bacterium]
MSSHVLDVGRMFAAPISFRAALIAAGAEPWNFLQIRRHMAAQVHTPLLKAIYFAFGTRVKTGYLAAALFIGLCTVLISRDPLQQLFHPLQWHWYTYAATAGALAFIALTLLFFDHWMLGTIGSDGMYQRRTTMGGVANDTELPPEVARYAENVRRERPDATLAVLYVSRDPFLLAWPTRSTDSSRSSSRSGTRTTSAGSPASSRRTERPRSGKRSGRPRGAGLISFYLISKPCSLSFAETCSII